MEQYMDFEKRVQQVHKPDRVNPEAVRNLSGTKITEEWKIVCKEDADMVVTTVVADLQEYFQVSVNLSLALVTGNAPAPKTIFVAVDESLPERSFRTQVSDGIVITGADPRYTAQGCYALEDTLNLNEAPIIELGDTTRKMRFSMRDINTGMGTECYPDDHLRAIAHAGYTAVDLGMRKALENEEDVRRVNEIVANAAKYGLDVYAYPGLRNSMHPDEPGAFEHYDKTYG